MADVAPRPAKLRTRAFRLSVWLGALVFAPLLRLLGATWRIEVRGPDLRDEPAPFLAVIWHAGVFCGAYHYRDRRLGIPVSQSRDGDRIDAVLQRLGFAPSPRGSSSRAGVQALAGMIRASRQGLAIAILCDGPRGPARHCKPGAAAVARATGLPVQQVGIAAAPAIRFPSWDRAFLPLPFARVAYVTGAPVAIARELSDDAFDAKVAEVERSLAAAQREAEEIVGLEPG